MVTLEIDVIKDQCLGKEVFRGSVSADELVKACWIDFHDLDRNPYGYQRPFDEKRSQLAADYANNEANAFWPECILAIRDNDEIEEEKDRVSWNFVEQPGSNGKFGKLIVTYNEENVENIGGKIVPWRRAFSEVDCQHRLGKMSSSTKQVTFCCFVDLKRTEEAIIFKTINAKQKRISTSLVDAIILVTDPQAQTHIRWAYDLSMDPGSAFNRLVDTGGRNLVPPTRLVTLRTLRTCLKIMMPDHLLAQGGDSIGYEFARNFWNVVKQMWGTEFSNPKDYKLMTVPGVKGLSRFGRHIFEKGADAQDASIGRIKAAFCNDPARIDWRAKGPLREASGNPGVRIIYDALIKAYPPIP
jgi:DGQHR domain-containing protein